MSLRGNEVAERPRINHKRKPSRKHKLTSQAEAERRRRQSAQQAARDHRDRVLPFRAWCAVNAFSEATGWRILKRGEGRGCCNYRPAASASANPTTPHGKQRGRDEKWRSEKARPRPPTTR